MYVCVCVCVCVCARLCGVPHNYFSSGHINSVINITVMVELGLLMMCMYSEEQRS